MALAVSGLKHLSAERATATPIQVAKRSQVAV